MTEEERRAAENKERGKDMRRAPKRGVILKHEDKGAMGQSQGLRGEGKH